MKLALLIPDINLFGNHNRSLIRCHEEVLKRNLSLELYVWYDEIDDMWGNSRHAKIYWVGDLYFRGIDDVNGIVSGV